MKPIISLQTLAGLSSSVEIRYSKKRKILVDVGPIFAKHKVQYKDIFLTHCHLDHCMNVFFIARLRAQMKLPPPTVYLPETSVNSFKEVKKTLGNLDGFEIDMNVIGLNGNSCFESDEEDQQPIYLFNGRVEVGWFSTSHRVPSLGYYFKQTGEYGSNDVIVTGDTDNKIFENESFKQLLQEDWERLVIECTYFGDRQKELSAKNYHVCLDDILLHLNLLSKVEILSLVHFSERFSITSILTEMREKVPNEWQSRIYPDFSLMNWKDKEYKDNISLIDLFELFLNKEKRRVPQVESK